MNNDILKKMANIFSNQQKVLEKIAQVKSPLDLAPDSGNTDQDEVKRKLNLLEEVHLYILGQHPGLSAPISLDNIKKILNGITSSTLTPEQLTKISQSVDGDIINLKDLISSI